MRETRKGPFIVNECPRLIIHKRNILSETLEKVAANLTHRKHRLWVSKCAECLFMRSYPTWAEAISNIEADKCHSCDRPEPNWGN